MQTAAGSLIAAEWLSIGQRQRLWETWDIKLNMYRESREIEMESGDGHVGYLIVIGYRYR